MSLNNSIYTTGTVVYTDIDISLRTGIVTNDIRTKNDVDAIKQQLRNVLFISKGEKPFQPDFDIGIYELLFEPFDEITTDVIKDRIKTAIENYVKRIELIDLEVRPTTDQNELSIVIKFNMLNIIEPQTIDLIVTRRR